ncbi:hypothetical protein BaRGS_00025713 [Batillaria attramentaria]|uniref:Uncharacterized protein n=1 Tax=Batillaria attramentaria TaxID=370345 RepID=A0ABD0K6N1_9CAEN
MTCGVPTVFSQTFRTNLAYTAVHNSKRRPFSAGVEPVGTHTDTVAYPAAPDKADSSRLLNSWRQLAKATHNDFEFATGGTRVNH